MTIVVSLRTALFFLEPTLLFLSIFSPPPASSSFSLFLSPLPSPFSNSLVLLPLISHSEFFSLPLFRLVHSFSPYSSFLFVVLTPSASPNSFSCSCSSFFSLLLFPFTSPSPFPLLFSSPSSATSSFLSLLLFPLF